MNLQLELQQELKPGLTLYPLVLKQRLVMYPHQEPVVKDIVEKYDSGLIYLVASCPGSGKTEMGIESFIQLIESKNADRILVIAHSTNTLKDNFYERLIKYFPEGDVAVFKGQKDYNYNARIQVVIPQNINHIIGEFDIIAVDEAHHNVLVENGNYSKIVKKTNPKYIILFTGTPSKFVMENKIAERDGLPKPYHINAIGIDKVGIDFFHKVKFDLIKSDYGFSLDDYNIDKDLLTNVKFSFENTEKTVKNVIIGVVRNIALRDGIELSKDSDFVLEGKKLIQNGDFGKTMFVCRNIVQAEQVAKIVSELFEVKVRVSDCKNDKNSLNISKFKKNQFEFICVVNRAREGYDDYNLWNLIDITMTHNIGIINQTFNRLVRKDDTNPKRKMYIKVTSNAEGMPEYTANITSAAIMLGATKNLENFDGKNFTSIVMPKIDVDKDGEDDVFVNINFEVEEYNVDINGNVNKVGVRKKRINDLLALDLVQMFTEDNENLISGQDRYATTTLEESLNKFIKGSFHLIKKDYIKLIREENISGGHEWVKLYIDLSKRDNIKYYSNPWSIFNQTVKEFFDECYIGRKIHSNKEDYIKLIIEENIIGSVYWLKKYKEFSKRDNIRYHSQPWIFFNQNETEFFDECYPERLKTREIRDFHSIKKDYFKIIRKNNINLAYEWRKINKKMSERDNVRYHLKPWEIFGQTVKEFFDECYPKRLEISYIKEEYFKTIRENNITGCKTWEKKYKKLIVKDVVKYHSQPWRIFNQTIIEFFNECYPERLEIQELNCVKEDYFKTIKENNITNPYGWRKNYKKLSSQNNTRFNSQPWRFFGQTTTEFFDEYIVWLNNNSLNKMHHTAYLGEFSKMNKTWNTTNSNTNHNRLNKNKSEWTEYHRLYSKARTSWKEIPYIELAKKIKGRPDWVVGDFGCGENLLSKEITNKIHSFDHVAIDDTVKSCDLTDVPLHNNVLDIVVFSLSLMGTNYKEYFDEAYRVLKPMGLVLIAEPATRWEDREEELKGILETSGFKVTGDIRHSDRFIYVDAIKY